MLYVALIGLFDALFMFPLLISASRSDKFQEQHLENSPKTLENSWLKSVM